MSIGEKIIAAITHDELAVVVYDQIHWEPFAAEQLEAVVEAHIEERVRVRLELDVEKRLVESDKIIRKLIELYDTDPRGDIAGYHATLNFVRRQCELPEITKPDEYPAD